MEDDDDRTTPAGLFHCAASYWRSGIALEKADVRATHPDAPICYLYYHAIELYLKAYPRAQGRSVRDLRVKFNHSPSKLRDAAQGYGL